jgi:AraC-like DNA-binding protein
MFKYRELQVKNSIAGFVKKLWILDNLKNSNFEQGKSVLPNGYFNIAIIEGKGVSATIGQTVTTLRKGIYFCGQMTKSVQVNIMPSTKATLIQLFPWTPSAFVSKDMSRFRDSIVEIKKAEQYSAYKLHESQYSNESAILELLYKNFPSLKQQFSEDRLIKSSCKLALQTNGNLSVQKLAAQSGVSIRLLQKKFKQALGLSPKEYLNILRLREAVDQLAFPDDTSSSGTGIALEGNYYDQAHFIHSFKKRIRTTPKKFDPLHYLLAFREKK